LSSNSIVVAGFGGAATATTGAGFACAAGAGVGAGIVAGFGAAATGTEAATEAAGFTEVIVVAKGTAAGVDSCRCFLASTFLSCICASSSFALCLLSEDIVMEPMSPSSSAIRSSLRIAVNVETGFTSSAALFSFSWLLSFSSSLFAEIVFIGWCLCCCCC